MKKLLVLSIAAILMVTFSMGLMAHSQNDFRLILSSNNNVYGVNYAYQQIGVDSYVINVKYHDAAGNVIETERFGGDNFTFSNGYYCKHSILPIPANCAYITATMRVTLLDGTRYSNITANTLFL